MVVNKRICITFGVPMSKMKKIKYNNRLSVELPIEFCNMLWVWVWIWNKRRYGHKFKPQHIYFVLFFHSWNICYFVLKGFLNLYRRSVFTTGLKMHMTGMCQGTVTGVHQFLCGSVMIIKRYVNWSSWQKVCPALIHRQVSALVCTMN